MGSKIWDSAVYMTLVVFLTTEIKGKNEIAFWLLLIGLIMAYLLKCFGKVDKYDFTQELKKSILKEIQEGNRSIPDKTSIIP